jgi:TonB family protein
MSRSLRIGCWLLLVLLFATFATGPGPARAAEGAADPAAALAEGQKHLDKGEKGPALESFRHAVELSGGTSVPGWVGVARSSLALRRYAAAVEAARKAKALASPEDQGTAAGLLGTALLARGDRADVTEAAAVWKDLLAAGGAHPEIARQGLVEALLQADRDHEAAEVLEAYRAQGAKEGDVRRLLCHVGNSLTARDSVNDRLRALDPQAALLPGAKPLPPQILERTAPQYPPQARKEKLGGTVILAAVVGTDGRAGDFEVLQGLPLGLTESAIESVKQWAFKPSTVDGTPVPVCHVITVSFHGQ